MKYLFFLLLISSAHALEIEVVVDGLKVAPEYVLLEVGDNVTVTAEAADSGGGPSSIKMIESYASESFWQKVQDTFDYYQPSPSTKHYVVSNKNAIAGSLNILIVSKNNNSIGKYHFAEFDDSYSLSMRVQAVQKEIDLKPARITKISAKKDGVLLNSSAILKVGDVVEATLEGVSADGSVVRGNIYSSHAREPFLQRAAEIRTLFLSHSIPLTKTFIVTKKNALSEFLSLDGLVWDGDNLGSNGLNGIDDNANIQFKVKPLPNGFEPDKAPSKLGKVTVSIQKKNGNVADALAKPQVFDGSQGKGSITTPGKNSPGAAGVKPQ